MRRVLGLVQLLALGTAFGAMVAPAPRTLLEAWTSFTIYPWWTLVLLGVGLGAAALSVAAPASAARVLVAAPVVTAVFAAHVGALGVWAYKHWLPAFGFGGGYAGDVPELKGLALIVAGAGTLASLAALGQLIVQHDWPRPLVAPTRLRRVGVGVAVLVGLPFLISTANPDLTDRNSLVALALIYSIPWGLALVASGWLSREGVIAGLAACACSAALSAVAPSNQITNGDAHAAFAGMTVLFSALLVAELRLTRHAVQPQGAIVSP